MRAKARALERAAKRLQVVTKETDWRVASAYAALAADASPLEQEQWQAKRKELGVASEPLGADSASGPAARAVDAYLDDDEWEARERAAGRAPPSERGHARASRSALNGPGFGLVHGWLARRGSSGADRREKRVSSP